MQRIIERQIDMLESLDRKAANLLGWNALLLGLFVNFARFLAGNPSPLIYALGAATVTFELVSILFGILAYQETQRWMGAPPHSLLALASREPDKAIRDQLLAETLGNLILGNQDSANRDLRKLYVCMHALFFGLLSGTLLVVNFIIEGVDS